MEKREEAFGAPYKAQETTVKRDGKDIELKNIAPDKLVRAVNALREMNKITDNNTLSAFSRILTWLVDRQEAYVENGWVVEVNRYHIYY